MRTTINVKDELLDALIQRTQIRSKTKAIEQAIREYLERKAIEDLIALSGQIHLDLDWQKEEERELNAYRDRG
jgi:metal-responsive CopG/Arc/MetJ family transcriptional regulator